MQITSAADVFAIGQVVLSLVLLGHRPEQLEIDYDAPSALDLLGEEDQTELQLARAFYQDDLLKLVTECIHREPAQRIEAEDLLERILQHTRSADENGKKMSEKKLERKQKLRYKADLYADLA